MNRVQALVFLFSISLTPVLCAQSTSASLTGRVIDPSKAVIADAKIIAVSDDTNLRYETTSDVTGEYHLANLPPSSYRIEIEKPGFKKVTKPDVILHVQDALAIDFEMTIGSTSDSITVEAGAPLVNTESGAVSTVIDRTFVDNLPLNGRSFQTLISLTPGVVLTPSVYDDQGQFSVNGQRTTANYFTVDGVSANFGVTGYIAMVETASGALPALSASGGTNSLVSVDAMQEFRIQTSSFAPEFGRTPGAQISIVTRSGTNAFHGSLSEYFRNSVLDAKDWFVNFNHLAKPEERLNDFGGVIGGPVFRERTFFFFSYEGLRLRQPSTQQTIVPSVQARQQAPAGIRPYWLDHAINSKLNLFGRYNYSPSTLVQRSPALASGPVLSMTQSLSTSIHTVTMGLTELITPRISNEVRANYSNDRIKGAFALDDFGGAVPLSDSQLFPPGFSSNNSAFGFYIPGVGQFNQGKSGTLEQRQVNIVDNLSWSQSGHQLKFGADYR